MTTRERITANFRTIPLGEAVEFLDYMRRPVKEDQRNPGPYPYYGANGKQGTIDQYLFDENLVLLAEDGGHFDDPSRGIAYSVSGKCWVNNHAHVLRPRGAFDVRFLTRVLENYDVAPFVTGTTRGKLTQAGAAQIPIPVRPLDEQRRIAAILDQADALRRKRAKAISELSRLPAAIFNKMFGNLVENEKGWPSSSVGDFVEGFESGKNIVAEDQNDSATRFRVLKVSAVTSLEFIESESKALPVGYEPPLQHFVREGDLLFSRANTSELVGATAYVERVSDGVTLPDKIWRFKWFGDNRVDPFFVWFLFRQSWFRDEIGKRATGTSGSMKNISQDKVLTIPVAFPPVSLQRNFAEKVRLIRNLREREKQNLVSLESLFSGLQENAFQRRQETPRSPIIQAAE